MKITQNPAPNTQNIERTRHTESSLPIEKNTKNSQPVSSDTYLNISDDAKMISRAIDIIRTTPDIRKEKVAELKKMIQEGAYKIDSEKLAEKIIEEHLATDFGKNNL